MIYIYIYTDGSLDRDNKIGGYGIYIEQHLD